MFYKNAMNNKLAALGYGKITKAISKKYNNGQLNIFDDKCKEDYIDENNNNIYPANKLIVEKFDVIIPSPGIPPYNEMILKAKGKIVSEFDFFYNPNIFYIWVTGTNGKSTLTNAIYQLLKDDNATIGGNIGYPLAKLDYSKKIHVYEASSFMLHYTNIAIPNISVILPITPDHIEWHKDMKHYKHDKLKHIKKMTECSIVFLPKELENIKTTAYKIIYDPNNIEKLAKEYNIQENNFNKVISGVIYKIIFDDIPHIKLKNLPIHLEHRIEPVKDSSGRVWYNDSKATNDASTIFALKQFNSKIHLIIGGYDKGLDYNDMFNILKQKNIILYIIGANSNNLEKLSIKYSINYKITNTLQNSIDEISKKLKNDEVALLSPATSSYDQFKSFEDRGKKFKELVSLI